MINSKEWKKSEPTESVGFGKFEYWKVATIDNRSKYCVGRMLRIYWITLQWIRVKDVENQWKRIYQAEESEDGH